MPETIVEPPSEVALALYRVVQESLTNVGKYARARTVHVRLGETDREILLTVADDGVGIAPEAVTRPGSHGVTGMRQRVAGFGGRFDIRRGADGGTEVSASFPLQTTDRASDG